MPKIVKPSSSIKEHKLETLQISKKDSHNVIEIHEDSYKSKSKTSSKVPFWESPDLSSGVENLFEAMGLKDNSSYMIISINLCRIKNMIQLFNLEHHEFGNLFSRQDFRDSVFQDSIIKVLCLGEFFKLLIKEKFELHEHIELPDKLILSTFEDETNLLDSDTMLILNLHYIIHY
jgi:hypothetical protein